MALTAKRQRFIDEYFLTGFNATEAAKRAGYSEKTAYSIGHENLKKPEIAAEIERRLIELHMPANELLARTADIARGDLTEWIDADGRLDVAALKASGKGHLLRKYRVTRRTHSTKGGDETETETIEIELYPADAAHDRLMRYHGLYNDKVRVTTWQDEVVELLRQGELPVDDVRAAYPDLADDFFARAGIQVKTDDRAD